MGEEALNINKDQIALGVRQPWCELILRGIKTVEVRSRSTQIRGPIYLYSSKLLDTSHDACEAIKNHQLKQEQLPCGVIVGEVSIVDCRLATPDDVDKACVSANRMEGKYCWELEEPLRIDNGLTPRFLPYGIWFYPFQRRH